MKMIVKHAFPTLLLALFTLGGCQSNNSSGAGLEDGSAAPGTDLVVANQGPDGPPDECDAMSEGTSTTLDCP
ncbi:hypothetical protein [Roseibium sp. Sym1]|uniref:hypothetical protein n=1 Tax=Roseibium sp. Sym1 TaxID=3016006 RepID=UPI0022B2FC42|nr:hypothetical protein [Roseibium sp. Sym1]